MAAPIIEAVRCNEDSYFFKRFYNHAVLGLKPTIQAHDKNWIEKIGDYGLTPVEKLPRKILNCVRDPRVITIALTSFALLADSYLFYDKQTVSCLKEAVALLPSIPLWTVKFAGYLTTVDIIASYGLRAGGRFSNPALMGQFYVPAPRPE